MISDGENIRHSNIGKMICHPKIYFHVWLGNALRDQPSRQLNQRPKVKIGSVSPSPYEGYHLLGTQGTQII